MAGVSQPGARAPLWWARGRGCGAACAGALCAATAVQHVQMVDAAGEHHSAPRGSAGSAGNLHGSASLLQLPRAVLQPGLGARAVPRREDVPAAPVRLSPCPPHESRARGAPAGPPRAASRQALHGRALAGRSAWEGASWNMQILVWRRA